MASEREIAIAEAITVTRNGPVKTAFGIPRSTLRDRLNGATNRSTAQQTTQKLTAEQEQGLIDSVKELEAQGSHTVIRGMVSKLKQPRTRLRIPRITGSIHTPIS
jgi:hypothetical protein